MSRHSLVLVAAVARNGVIGADGRMPWRLPGDLAWFRDVTMGCALLMGRKTFESIGRPLPGRLTTVLSRSPTFAPAGITVAHDLAAGLTSAGEQADELGATAVMVVGGGAVYAATIGSADRLILTEVDAAPVGEIRFPPIDPDVWVKASDHPAARRSGDTGAYRHVIWRRRQPA